VIQLSFSRAHLKANERKGHLRSDFDTKKTGAGCAFPETMQFSGQTAKPVGSGSRAKAQEKRLE